MDYYNALVNRSPLTWRPFFVEREENVKKIAQILSNDIENGYNIIPRPALVLAPFILTPLDHIKVVILGQDPYPREDDATGLAFSIPRGRPISSSPSLNNMFKVLEKTVEGWKRPHHGNLEKWALQGVLMINTALTLREGDRNSHGRVWQQLIDPLIEYISSDTKHCVFMLWGGQAQEKKSRIDGTRHKILTTSHPSPLGAMSGFLDCDHFNQANQYLIEHERDPVDWRIV